MSKKSIIYIDGFNLYYGALKGTKYRWLDLQTLFERVRPHDEIVAIEYFTARVRGISGKRQETYLKALLTKPLIEIIEGKFNLNKKVKCNVSSCNFGGKKLFVKPEEKRTDVNIAISMLLDAFHDECDRLILVSGDGDLVPAIAAVKQEKPEKEVIVYTPARNRFTASKRGSSELKSYADKTRDLPFDKIKRAQFKEELKDGKGSILQKPKEWF